MKKIISFISIVMILIFAFSGCGTNTQDKPEDVNTANGVLSSFTTTDIDGKSVDASVFKGKKLTMVNIWATYCGPCINEMPHLGEISKEYADKDFQIIGIALDVVDYYTGGLSESQVALAKDIIAQTGADYLHIVPSDSLNNAKLYQVTSIPETIFVDENGCQIGESIIGAKTKEAWIEIIEDRLEQVK